MSSTVSKNYIYRIVHSGGFNGYPDLPSLKEAIPLFPNIYHFKRYNKDTRFWEFFDPNR